MRILAASQAEWVVIENVPGLLTSDRGRDFHTVLATLAELGYVDRAYRILDSRYFGVAQRRRRVFVVGRAGAEFGRAAAVLLEQSRGGRDSAARGEARARVARGAADGADGAGELEELTAGEAQIRRVYSPRGCAPALQAGRNRHNAPACGVHANQRGELRPSDLAGSLTAQRSGKQFDGVMQAPVAFNWQTGGDCRYGFGDTTTGLSTTQTPAVYAIPIQYAEQHDRDTRVNGMGLGENGDPSFSLECRNVHGVLYSIGEAMDNLPVAATLNSGGDSGGFRTEPVEHVVPDLAPCLETTAGDYSRADGFVSTPVQAAGVRRLTPLECERLQGFPDGWTCLCPAQGDTATCVCPDSPRYKQCGNAVTVSVIRWIAARLRAVAAGRVAA